MTERNPLDLELHSSPKRIKFLRKIKQKEDLYHTETLKGAVKAIKKAYQTTPRTIKINASQNQNPERNEED